jgi:hypothetical protein
MLLMMAFLSETKPAAQLVLPIAPRHLTGVPRKTQRATYAMCYTEGYVCIRLTANECCGFTKSSCQQCQHV